MKIAHLLRLIMLRCVTGMKLDTGKRAHGICLMVWRALKPVALLAALARLVVLVFGVTGLVPAGASADELSGLADPTRPAYNVEAAAGSGPAKPTGPELQSTFISASKRRAVISGKSYTLGDKFGGGTISEIQPYEVVLKIANRETHLRLLPKLAKETHMIKVLANSQEGGEK